MTVFVHYSRLVRIENKNGIDLPLTASAENRRDNALFKIVTE